MDSELTHAQGHHYKSSDLSGYPAGQPTGGEGHQEKPSMMNRVKAKAKKMRKRLMPGQGHDHDQDHSRSQEDEEDDEEEDEEIVQDHEIHGAPINDKGATRASDGQFVTPGTKLDSLSPQYNSPIVEPEVKPLVQRQADEDEGKHLLKEDDHAPLPSKLVDTRGGQDKNPELPYKGIHKRTGNDVYEEKENADQVGGSNAMEGIQGIGTNQSPDIRAHPSDDQIKTIDPASRGSEEVAAGGITPIIKSFNQMGFAEEKPKKEQEKGGGLYTGSHNQFSFEPVPSESSDSVSESHNAANPRDIPSFESSDSVSKSHNAANPLDMPSFESSDSVSKSHNAANPRDIAANPRDMPSFESSDSISKSHNAANLRDIAANPRDMPSFESSDSVSKSHNAANLRDIAANPRDMPSFESSDSVSKSHNAANPQDMPSFESSDSANPRDMPTSESSDYVSKSYNAANPQDMPTSESFDSVPKSLDAANHQDMSSFESSESVPKSYNATDSQDMPEDLHDQASQSSTYTEKITSASAAAASAIAGTAQSAKNAISSKIGQTHEPGEVSKPRSVMETEPVEGNKPGSVMGTASDYAYNIAATVTDTLSPVYGKVVGVGTGTTPKVSELGAETTQESSEIVGKDKGASVEKLKPDEEYKPLSSIMIESLNESKEEKMEEVPSDAVHKREPEEIQEQKPMGKVTESEEVAKRLGTEEEGSGLGNPGAGVSMVSKLTGAIGSWLGGQGGAAQSTPGTTLADDNEGGMGKKADDHGVTGEGRLQE